MDYLKFLTEMTTIPGMSGYEASVAEAMAGAFAPYCDETKVDRNQSVIAVQRGSGKGPKVMLCAHIDEVGLMTTLVEEDGSVRFISRGVAAQTLPAQEVTLLTKDGPLYGVIGAMPPHLTDRAARDQVTPVDELFIDTGLPADEVRRRVPAGTPVQLTGRTMALENDLVASKTLDDRACVATLLHCAQQIRRRLHAADVYYVLSAREEIDSFGALTAAERLSPDMAVIIDVTHGTMPGCEEGETYPLDCTTLFAGPNAHRKLTDQIRAHAQRLGMKTQIEVAPGNSYTDAWEVQVAGLGVPCAIMSLPLKYMHTTVEIGSVELMRKQALLMCEAVCALDEGWEETLCY